MGKMRIRKDKKYRDKPRKIRGKWEVNVIMRKIAGKRVKK